MVSLGCSMAVILMCMCGQMLYDGVGVVSKGSGMRLNGPVSVGSTELSSLVFLGCTALMRANSPKHPSRCLQFAQR